MQRSTDDTWFGHRASILYFLVSPTLSPSPCQDKVRAEYGCSSLSALEAEGVMELRRPRSVYVYLVQGEGTTSPMGQLAAMSTTNFPDTG